METASAYDDLDLPVSVTVGPDDPVTGGGETLWTYDNMGQMKGRTIRSHDGITANQATYDYDINGRLTRITDGRGVPTRIAYDGRGRPASRTTPGNGTTSLIYVDQPLDPFKGSRFPGVAVQTLDAEGVASTAYADSLGRTRYVIAADGTSAENIFSNGLLTEQRRYTDTCALRGVKRFYYAPNSSRLRFETEWMTSAQAAACTGTPPCAGIGHTEYTYTSAGRVATVRDPAGNVSSTTYLDDASGLPARSVVGGVTEIAYEYLTGLPRLAAQVQDPDGTPLRTEITWERGTRIQSLRWTASGKPQEIVEHQYDEAGLTKQSRVLQGPSPTPRVVVNRSWTPAGQLATKQYTVDGLPFSPTAWAYELNGQLAAVQYPSGNVADYDYVTGTRLLERIRLGGGPSILGSMTYNRAGRPTAMLLAGSAAETHVAATIAYDWAGRAVTRNISGVAPSGLRTESFAYDSAGRLALLNTAEAAANWSKNYEYDHRDMLVREVHTATDPARPNLEIGYTLHPVTGRRMQRQAVGPTSTNVLALAYGTGNQLATVNGLAIGHDTYGRQLNDHRGNGYEWNLRGRLAAIIETNSPLPKIEAMLFDPDGQRVRRQYEGAVAHFLLADHPGRVLHQTLAGGATRDFIYGPGGALLAQVSGAGAVTPILESITASPALIGSSTSGLFERDFDGFGNALDVNGTPNSDADFHGMWATRGTSRLKAAGHRFYDPELGRFLSTDPLGFSGGTGPGRMDLYRYASQSPTLYRDPEGLYAQPLRGGRQAGLIFLDHRPSSVAGSGIERPNEFGARAVYFFDPRKHISVPEIEMTPNLKPKGCFPVPIYEVATEDTADQGETSGDGAGGEGGDGGEDGGGQQGSTASELPGCDGPLCIADFEEEVHVTAEPGAVGGVVGWARPPNEEDADRDSPDADSQEGPEDFLGIGTLLSGGANNYPPNGTITSELGALDITVDQSGTEILLKWGPFFGSQVGRAPDGRVKLATELYKTSETTSDAMWRQQVATFYAAKGDAAIIGSMLGGAFYAKPLASRLAAQLMAQTVANTELLATQVTKESVRIAAQNLALRVASMAATESSTAAVAGTASASAGVVTAAALVGAGATGYGIGTLINNYALPDSAKVGIQAAYSISPLGLALGGAEFWDDPNNYQLAGD